MTTTVEALYEDGMLKLPRRLPLPEKAHVKVTIDSGTAEGEDTERGAWLKLSKDALTATWANPDDDVFNEILQRGNSPAAVSFHRPDQPQGAACGGHWSQHACGRPVRRPHFIGAAERGFAISGLASSRVE